jgi:Cu/Ag efflux protein CusF
LTPLKKEQEAKMQKSHDRIDRKIVVALLLAVLSAGSVFAKGRTQRLEGTVTAIGNNYVTIETKAHQVLNVGITNATKFFKQKKVSSLSEMKTGDHVVFLATPSADATSKNTPSASNTQKDTLSLGIGFTAVQASY